MIIEMHLLCRFQSITLKIISCATYVKKWKQNRIFLLSLLILQQTEVENYNRYDKVLHTKTEKSKLVYVHIT